MISEDPDDLQNSIATLIADVAGPHSASEALAIEEAARALNAGDHASLAFYMAQKRADGAPLGLLTGRQIFMGLQLMAGPEVLVAREETELLGLEVISILRAESAEYPDRDLRLIDMGCGSGNITCAAAVAVPRLRVWASDLTESCAALTRCNVTLHSLNDRVDVSQGDLFEPLRGRGLESTMDVVEMNPPYIASTSLEKQKAALLHHEPREAFDGGPFGITILTRLIREAPVFLKPNGHLLFEFGQGQAKQVNMLVERSKLYSEIRFASDQNGEPRVAILRSCP